MAQYRWIVETGYRYLQKWKSIDHVVPYSDLHNVDNSYYLAFGMSVFCKPMGGWNEKMPKCKTRLDAFLTARKMCPQR
jgi:hypothetical protein